MLWNGQKADYLSITQLYLILFVILTIESPETVVIRFNPRIMIRCQQIKESSCSSGFTSSSSQQLQPGQLCYDDDCTLALLIWWYTYHLKHAILFQRILNFFYINASFDYVAWLGPGNNTRSISSSLSLAVTEDLLSTLNRVNPTQRMS